MARRQRKERRTFEDLELRFRRAQDVGEWWQAVCDAGKGLDFAWVSLMSRDGDGNLDTRVWRGTAPSPSTPIVTMSLPVKKANSPVRMEFEVAIAVDESLESAGRRGALFSRLIDEHGSVVSDSAACAVAPAE